MENFKETELKKYILPLMIMPLLLSACTSIKTKPLDRSLGVSHICIQKNPKVTVPDFLSVVRNGFDDHGISSSVFDGAVPYDCQYVLTYTALRSWDFVTYLSHAELRLQDRHGKRVAYGQLHLKGKGGFAFTKWKSVETKMNLVIDEMLHSYEPGEDYLLPVTSNTETGSQSSKKTSEGISKEDFIEIMGLPYKTTKNINGEFLTYNVHGKSKTYFFKNGVLCKPKVKLEN